MRLCELPRIRPLQRAYARVVAQTPGELPPADIDGVDARGAAAEQHINETARRGTQVQADRTGRVETESLQPGLQLDAAARDPGVIATGDGQLRSFFQFLARLAERTTVAEHQPSRDQRLGSVSTLGQTSGHQQTVRALPHAATGLSSRPKRSRQAKRTVSPTAATANPTASPIQIPTPSNPRGKAKAQAATAPTPQ